MAKTLRVKNIIKQQTIKNDKIMRNKTRYIVVIFRNRVAYTYQMDGKFRWYFNHNVLNYIKLDYAKKLAEKIGKENPNLKVCVFKMELGEDLSNVKFHDWYQDVSRLMFEFLYDNKG